MRIAVLNNYDLTREEAWVRAGHAPAHFLYGLRHLRQTGHHVDVLPFPGHPMLAALDRALRAGRLSHFTGSLRMELPLLRRLEHYDVIYAPCENQTGLLAWLRHLRIIRTPLVTLAHHPPPGGALAAPFNRMLVRSASAFPSISPLSARQWQELAAPGPVCPFLPWGPDLPYYPAYQPPEEGVLVSGRTNRDWDVIARAAPRLATSLTLFSAAVPDPRRWLALSPRIRITEPPRDPWTYDDILPHIARALAVAIPLRRNSNLGGLTSLLDAMAMGRAVLMTYNPHVHPDIEKAGIGRWVQPGDATGWIEAINHLAAHPEEACAMGARARLLVEEGLDARHFDERMADLLTSAATQGRSAS
jgi:glycosyltransferase involved in cell wall biosynthesis